MTAAMRPARASDAPSLTELAFRAKASWGSDQAFMEACRAELTVTPEAIAQAETWIIEVDGAIAGYYQLLCPDREAEVAAVFVAPAHQRRGLGHRLWAHLEATARRLGAMKLEVDSDPYAEGFYRAMGMRPAGTAPSGSIPGRLLPHLRKEL